MQRRRLGALEVSAVGLGCATMTPFYDQPNRDAAIDTLRRAREIGVDFLDSSDAYGQGRNEELIASAVKGHRSEYIIASKFGNLRAADGSPTSDGRPEYVKACCERSLKRLETDVIYLYYIHRVDPTIPIEDTVGAMSDLVREGKVRHLGICEAGVMTIRRGLTLSEIKDPGAESRVRRIEGRPLALQPAGSPPNRSPRARSSRQAPTSSIRRIGAARAAGSSAARSTILTASISRLPRISISCSGHPERSSPARDTVSSETTSSHAKFLVRVSSRLAVLTASPIAVIEAALP